MDKREIGASKFGRDMGLENDHEQYFLNVAPTGEPFKELVTAHFPTDAEAEQHLKWLFDGYAKNRGKHVYWRFFPSVKAVKSGDETMYFGHMGVLVSRFKKAYIEDAA